MQTPINKPPPSSATGLQKFVTEARELEGAIRDATNKSDISSLKRELQDLRLQVSQGVEWWTDYDIARNQQTIASLELGIDNLTRRFSPRARFRFARHTPSQPPSIPRAPEVTREARFAESTARREAGSAGGDRRDVTVSHARGRRIELGEGFAARVRDAVGCEITGSISGSVQLDDVRACVIRVKCRQLRMTKCERCLIFADVVSGPVVEGCRDVCFAKGGKGEKWREVVDFSNAGEGGGGWRLLEGGDGEAEEGLVRKAAAEEGVVAESGNCFFLADGMAGEVNLR